MAKKSIINREKRREKLVAKYAEKRLEIKSKIRLATLYEDMQQLQTALAKLPVNSCAVRQTRRCNQCGRAHAVYKKFALCRICLREHLMVGDVTGGRKSSW